MLLRVNEQRNILHEIRKRKANWIGHILRRNCFLKQVIEGKIKGEMEVRRRRGWRRKKLLDDLKDRRGYSHLKEEALDRTMWRKDFRGGFGLSSDRIWNEYTNGISESYSEVHTLYLEKPTNQQSTPHSARSFWLLPLALEDILIYLLTCCVQQFTADCWPLLCCDAEG